MCPLSINKSDTEMSSLSIDCFGSGCFDGERGLGTVIGVNYFITHFANKNVTDQTTAPSSPLATTNRELGFIMDYRREERRNPVVGMKKKGSLGRDWINTSRTKGAMIE
jgi:hypothetical protein